jgi:hypothetical protein
MKEDNTNYMAFMASDSKSITLSDYGRILNLIQNDLGNNQVPLQILHHLYIMTATSRKYYPERIPEDVVTMNSEIILILDNNRKQKIKIVFPRDVKGPDDVSIYTPMGAACLGAHEKSEICFFDGNSVNRAIIEKVLFQPEKEKLFSL